MAAYKTSFDLSIDDMELLENALRTASNEKSAFPVDPRAANDLLGRLHNQKIFFRPKDKVYISG